jgi:hypothetical protein
LKISNRTAVSESASTKLPVTDLKQAHAIVETHVYYVAKNSSGVYDIFDYDTKTECTKSYFGAGHRHGLAVREVIDLFIA